MLESLKLEVANLLNGVPVEQVARLAGDTPEDVTARFVAVMRLVSEYQLVHCVPMFECGSIGTARRNRLTVMAVLEAIERWDSFEHDLVLKVFKNQPFGDISRSDLQKIMQRTLDAIPHYLHQSEQAGYLQDRIKFIASNKKRVIEVLERFVSFNNPRIYGRIEHIGIDANNLEQVTATMVQ